MNDSTISAVMKHLRSRVDPAHCARTPEQAKAAANARWIKYRAKQPKLGKVRTRKKFKKNGKKS